MGLDGGTKISRSDVLRGSSWRLAKADGSRSTRGGAVSTSAVYEEPQLDATAERQVSWTTCSISGEPLEAPLVADGLGRLYSKSAVLEFLLCRKGAPADEAAVARFANQLRTSGAAFEHIRSLRDVFTLHLTPNTAGEGSADSRPYMCPITLLPCAGSYPFAALRSCGHVFSERALSNIHDSTCPTCSQPFGEQDAITLNGSVQRVAELRRQMLAAQQQQQDGKHKSGKDKGSKRKREGRVADEGQRSQPPASTAPVIQ